MSNEDLKSEQNNLPVFNTHNDRNKSLNNNSNINKINLSLNNNKTQMRI